MLYVWHGATGATCVQGAVASPGTVISPAAHVMARSDAAAGRAAGASQTKRVGLAKTAANVSSELFQKFVDDFNARGRFSVSDAGYVK
jgi:tetrahydromethanopterin S-methyltransferase subunit A